MGYVAGSAPWRRSSCGRRSSPKARLRRRGSPPAGEWSSGGWPLPPAVPSSVVMYTLMPASVGVRAFLPNRPANRAIAERRESSDWNHQRGCHPACDVAQQAARRVRRVRVGLHIRRRRLRVVVVGGGGWFSLRRNGRGHPRSNAQLCAILETTGNVRKAENHVWETKGRRFKSGHSDRSLLIGRPRDTSPG